MGREHKMRNLTRRSGLSRLAGVGAPRREWLQSAVNLPCRVMSTAAVQFSHCFRPCGPQYICRVAVSYSCIKGKVSGSKQSRSNCLIPAQIKHFPIAYYRAGHHLGLGGDLRVCL